MILVSFTSAYDMYYAVRTMQMVFYHGTILKMDKSAFPGTCGVVYSTIQNEHQTWSSIAHLKNAQALPSLQPQSKILLHIKELALLLSPLKFHYTNRLNSHGSLVPWNFSQYE